MRLLPPFLGDPQDPGNPRDPLISSETAIRLQTSSTKWQPRVCELGPEPQMTPNWHEQGRHKPISDIQTGILRRISLQIQPWGSHPFHLNVFNQVCHLKISTSEF